MNPSLHKLLGPINNTLMRLVGHRGKPFLQSGDLRNPEVHFARQNKAHMVRSALQEYPHIWKPYLQQRVQLLQLAEGRRRQRLCKHHGSLARHLRHSVHARAAKIGCGCLRSPKRCSNLLKAANLAVLQGPKENRLFCVTVASHRTAC